MREEIQSDLRFDSYALTGFDEGLTSLTGGIVDIKANVMAQVMRK